MSVWKLGKGRYTPSNIYRVRHRHYIFFETSLVEMKKLQILNEDERVNAGGNSQYTTYEAVFEIQCYMFLQSIPSGKEVDGLETLEPY